MHPRRQQFNYWASTFFDVARGSRSRSIFVTGYVRSGTNWLCNLLSAYTGIPVNEPWNDRWPALEPRIFHLHRILPFEAVRTRGIYALRDGRDTLISWYFYTLNHPPMKAAAERHVGRELTVDGMAENLERFVRYAAVRTTSTPDWATHVRAWRKHRYNTVRYEDLTRDPEETLAAALERLTGERADPDRVHQAVEVNRFARKAARERGDEDPSRFLRKGIVGDWRNYFTRAAARAFDEVAGEELVLAGYEQDRSWPDRLDG